MNQAIEELRQYIVEHNGNISDALDKVGGIRRVRAVLGLPDYAVLDPRLYVLGEEWL